MSKTYSIISRHENLLSAVIESGIDLSYNKGLAISDIKHLEAQKEFGGAFVVETDRGTEVLYIFRADIALLNRFEPFHSCLDSNPFNLAEIEGDNIVITDLRLPKTPEIRKFISSAQNSAPKAIYATTL